MALIPVDLPLQLEENLVAAKTTGNGDCLYNAVSLVLNGTESYTSLLRLLVALELLLNKDYYIQHPRLTSFSNTDSHHPDTLFSLCLTTNSDQFFHDIGCCREKAIWSEARVASKSCEWSGFFFIFLLYQAFLPGPFSQPIRTVTPGSAISCTMKKVPEILPWFLRSRSSCCGREMVTWITELVRGLPRIILYPCTSWDKRGKNVNRKSLIRKTASREARKV